MMLTNVIYHDEDGNGHIEPGEHVNIGIGLMNAGLRTANNLSAELISNSEYITVIQPRSDFPPARYLENTSNLDYFRIYVHPDTPNDYTVNATLRITNTIFETEQTWHRLISFTVKTPHIAYRSFFINDREGGNRNGILEAGETAKLIINLTNPNPMDVLNANVTISAERSEITIIDGAFTLPRMSNNNVYQAVFTISVSENITNQTIVPITFQVTAQNAPIMERTIDIPINHNPLLINESFASMPPSGWSYVGSQNFWSLSQTNNAGGSVPEARFSGSSYTSSQTATSRLVTRSLVTTDTNVMRLTFRTAAIVEPGSGTLTIGVSTRASSTTWTNVWTRVLNADMEAEQIEVIIRDGHLHQDGFIISFFVDGRIERMTEWFIDDVTLESAVGNTAIVTGNISINDYERDITEIKVRARDFVSMARPDSSYILYLLPRIYPNIQIINSFIDGRPHSNNDLQADSIYVRNFNVHYRVPPKNLTKFMDEEHFVKLTWEHPYSYDTNAINFRHFNIYKQTNSLGFVRIAQTDSMSFIDHELSENNRYRYFVRAQYSIAESDSSNHIFVNPNVHDVSDLEDGNVIQPLVFELAQNFPNPFNPTTNIRFTIPEATNVSVKIYNVRGQLVRHLHNDFMNSGTHLIQWHGDNDQGRTVGSGIYFIRVQDGNNNNAVRKSVLLK
jgi:hypothetical protein